MTQQVHTGRVPSGTVPRPQRPGLVLFAAVMMFTEAGFLLVAAISEWSNSVWLYQRNFEIAGSRVVVWGFIDFALAALAAYAAYMILDGRRSGQIIGLIWAGISAVRWLFYIPADPWLALTILAVDALVIYGLTAYDDYFAANG